VCAGNAGVVPIITADAGAAPMNAEYQGMTLVITAMQMKPPEVAVPAKIPGVVRKIKPSSTDMDE